MSSVGLNDYGGPPEVLHLMKPPYRHPEPGQVHVAPPAIPLPRTPHFLLPPPAMPSIHCVCYRARPCFSPRLPAQWAPQF